MALMAHNEIASFLSFFLQYPVLCGVRIRPADIASSQSVAAAKIGVRNSK